MAGVEPVEGERILGSHPGTEDQGDSQLVVVGLQTRRKAKGLTQRQLAERAEIAVTTVRGIESGDRNPRVATVGRLAVALGISVDELCSPMPIDLAMLAHEVAERSVRLWEAIDDFTDGGEQLSQDDAEQMVAHLSDDDVEELQSVCGYLLMSLNRVAPVVDDAFERMWESE